MRQTHIFILIIIILNLLLFSCNPSSTTTNEDLFWMEHEGYFYTTDLDRAQENIPFTILLPEYMPGGGQNIPIPQIDGPLKESQDDIEGVEINIEYAINIGDDLPALIIIHECNSSCGIGEPEVDPELEQVMIKGIQVIKTKDEWSPGTDTYYSFNANNIYYVIEMHNLPDDESFMIVESMIIQLE